MWGIEMGIDLEEITSKFQEFKDMKKAELEPKLIELEEKFYDKTGLDLQFIVKSYKMSLTGSYDEKSDLRDEALTEDKEREYWIGHGLSFGDRAALAGMLELLGKKARSAKYAARVVEAYIAADACLHLTDNTVFGLVKQGVEKAKVKKAELEQRLKDERQKKEDEKPKKPVEYLTPEDEELASWTDDGDDSPGYEQPTGDDDSGDLW